MAAPIGNDYAKKGKLFERAIMSVLRESDGEQLITIARQLLKKASKGDLHAISMIADRLDGRVLPQLPDTGDGTLVISWIQSAQPAPVDVTPAPQVIEHTAKPEDDPGVP